MPLSQADLKVISTVFGKPVDEISGALSSDQEVSLDLRLNGKILSDDEIRTTKENAVKQGKELGYKEIAKNLDLDLDAGEKDPVVIADKFKANLSKIFEDKYKNPNPTEELIAQAKKTAEWEEKYTKLFNTHKTVEQEAKTLKQALENKDLEIAEKALNNEILGFLPKDISLEHSDALLIIKNSLKIETDENGKRVIYKGGKKQTDPVGEPETLENVIKAFTEEKGWIKKEGGMGGSDRGGAGGSGKKGLTPDQARNYLIEKGITPASAEGLKLFNELTSK